MADIFLSYSSHDKERIRQLAEMLSKVGGWSVWWDSAIPFGKTFDDVINEELINARCVLVAWSHQSVGSQWVKEEAQEGLNRKILIPVSIDNVSIPLGFRRLQTANLAAWDGSATDTQFKKLINDIKIILGPPQERTQATLRPKDGGMPTGRITVAPAFRYKPKLALLITIGWAIGGAIGVTLVGTVGWPIIGTGVGAANGLVTGYALHLAEPAFRWRQMTVVVLGLAVSGAGGWAVAEAVSGAGVGAGSGSSGGAAIGALVAATLGAFFGTVLGAVDGLITGYALHLVEPAFRGKQITKTVFGWSIGGAIAGAIGWAVGGAGVGAGGMPNIGTVGWALVGAVSGAIKGAVGGGFTMWCLNEPRAKTEPDRKPWSGDY